MLIAKGYAVGVKIGGRWRQLPGALLHDETGKTWPHTSALVMAFDRDEARCADPRASSYFGARYRVRQGSLDLPSKSLSEWRLVAEVEAIDYSRLGELSGDYRHKFGDGLLATIFSDRKPKLYVCARCRHVHRIELGRNAEWDWRGIVRP